jgi:hypothetical protein
MRPTVFLAALCAVLSISADVRPKQTHRRTPLGLRRVMAEGAERVVEGRPAGLFRGVMRVLRILLAAAAATLIATAGEVRPARPNTTWWDARSEAAVRRSQAVRLLTVLLSGPR